MFSNIKIEEYMESEPFGIFLVKLVAKNIVLGSPGIDFMHMRVKSVLLLTLRTPQNNSERLLPHKPFSPIRSHQQIF